MADYDTWFRACTALDAASAERLSLFGFRPQGLLQRLAAGPLSLTALEDEYRGDTTALAGFLGFVAALMAGRAIEFLNEPGGGLALRYTADRVAAPEQQLKRQAFYKLSKFTSLRNHDGTMVIEHPLGAAFAIVHDAGLLPMVHAFARPRRPDDCRSSQLSALNLLLNSGALIECDASGLSREETDADLAHWEFHDLLFHARSRPGKHGYPAGNTYRESSRFPAPADKKTNPWREHRIALPAPDGSRRNWLLTDAPQLFYRRKTERTFGSAPLTLNSLGEYLWTLFTPRPGKGTPAYPSAGGIYHLEPYLYVDNCLGVPPGFYYYDNSLHALCHICPPDADTEAIMHNARNTMGTATRPQVIVCLASRFRLMSWKYESVAYALQLKDVGAIFATMYLLATAMGIAPCALGSGPSEEFGRLTGLPCPTESLVGEFALGC